MACFTHLFASGIGWGPDGAEPFLGNTNGPDESSGPWSILFNAEQGNVAFTLATKQSSNFKLTAFLAGLVVDTFDIAGGPNTDGSYGYYGFTGIEFDKIEMAAALSGDYMDFTLIDNLQFSAVPLPAAIWLFGTALLGFIGLSRRIII